MRAKKLYKYLQHKNKKGKKTRNYKISEKPIDRSEWWSRARSISDYIGWLLLHLRIRDMQQHIGQVKKWRRSPFFLLVRLAQLFSLVDCLFAVRGMNFALLALDFRAAMQKHARTINNSREGTREKDASTLLPINCGENIMGNITVNTLLYTVQLRIHWSLRVTCIFPFTLNVLLCVPATN